MSLQALARIVVAVNADSMATWFTSPRSATSCSSDTQGRDDGRMP
jgi:hypothetical protein